MLDSTQQGLLDSSGTVTSSNKSVGSQAMVLQGHANLISQQAVVDLSGFDSLSQYQSEINNSIGSAKQHANTYIQVILPKMIGTSTNIDRYFNLQNALAAALRPDTPVAMATKLIGAVQDQAMQFHSDSQDVAASLGTLNVNLNADASNFKGFVNGMNAAVSGDNGVLDQIHDQLGTYDKQIAGASSAIALGGLAILGGGLMIAVGAIAEFITGGTSTALVVAGVGVAAVGVAATVAGGITLSKLLDAKGELLAKEARLEAEVKYALSITGNFQTIANSCASGAQAAGEMGNTWGMMTDHLGNLISDLESGKTSVDAMRMLFLSAAQGDVKNVLSDNAMIQRQLSGVSTVNTGNTPGSLSAKIASVSKAA